MARIAIDGSCWTNQRGYGRYMREVLGELWRIDTDNEYIVVTDSISLAQAPLPEGIPVHVAELGQSPGDGAAAGSRRSVGDLLAMGRAAREVDCDVFFFSSVFSYFPYHGRGRVVLIIHDAIAERHPREVFPDWKSRLFWKIKTWLAMRETDRLVTVSEYSRREIADVFGVPVGSIDVVSESASGVFWDARGTPLPDALRGRIGLAPSESYFLYVGGFAPHKNLIRLVRAYGELYRTQGDRTPGLVMVGEIEKQTFLSNIREIQGLVEELGLTQRVHFPGFVPDAELAPLYANSTALLLPSLREGFGLPAVEAAAAGAPVVATRNSPLPEVLEGGGIFVDPADEPALAEALTRLATDSAARDAFAQQAHARASALSWTESARALKRCFEETAAAR